MMSGTPSFLSLPTELVAITLAELDACTLTAVARVSRYLHELAAPLLYCCIPDPFPLLQFLPLEYGPVDFTPAVPASAISRQEWAHFQSVAGWVRHVRFSERDTRACVHCINAISRQLMESGIPGCDNLLPNLQSFMGDFDTLRGLQSASPWFSPSLRALELDLGPDVPDITVVQCLGHLSRQCPSIACVCLQVDSVLLPQRVRIVQAIVGLVQRSVHLLQVCLPFDMLSDAVLDALVMLPRLEEFLVSPAASPLAPFDMQFRAATLGAGQFPSLRRFHLHAPLCDAASLVCATTEDLDEIRITSRALTHHDEVSTALRRIVDFCAQPTHFRLKLERAADQETDGWMDLSPLLACDSLEHVSISHRRPLALTDADVEEMLHAWQNLTYLSLSPRPWREHRVTYTGPLPSLGCLRTVARSGTRLKYFGAYLGIDAVVPSMNRAVVQSSLRAVDLGKSGGSHEGGEYAIAELIKALFPSAQVVARDDASQWVKRVAWRMGNQT